MSGGHNEAENEILNCDERRMESFVRDIAEKTGICGYNRPGFSADNDYVVATLESIMYPFEAVAEHQERSKCELICRVVC